MSHRLVPLLLLVITALVAALTLTALPSLGSDHLAGTPLMLHMMASGGLVVLLPVLGWMAIGGLFATCATAPTARLGYWSLMLTGWVTIATVFACMLPVMGTDAMHKTIVVHAYAGFAMVPAVVLFWIGWTSLRMRSKRASKPG